MAGIRVRDTCRDLSQLRTRLATDIFLLCEKGFSHGRVDRLDALHELHAVLTGLEVGMEVVKIKRVGVGLHLDGFLDSIGEGLDDGGIGALLEAEVVEPLGGEVEAELTGAGDGRPGRR